MSSRLGFPPQNANSGNHSSNDGIFELKLNDGSTWCLFVSSEEVAGNVTLRFVPADMDGTNR